MRNGFILLVLAVPMPLGLAQPSSFVVPSRQATRPGNTYDQYLFGSAFQPVHEQWLYDIADIAVPAAVLNSMCLRRSAKTIGGCPSGTADVQTILSMGPNDPATASTCFAGNLGINQTTVYSGLLTLPATPHTPLAPFNTLLPFARPFLYSPALGRSLVVDIACRSFIPSSGSESWFLDVQKAGPGTMVPNMAWSNCKLSNSKTCGSSISYVLPSAGGAWYVRYNSLPANPSGLGALGVLGAGASWMGILLPLDLAPLGAPGCGWATNISFLTVLIPGISGTDHYLQWPQIQIPNDPALAHAAFYDQAAVLDPTANSLGLVSCRSSQWFIGDNAPPPGRLLYYYPDTTPPCPMGTLLKNAVVVEFGL